MNHEHTDRSLGKHTVYVVMIASSHKVMKLTGTASCGAELVRSEYEALVESSLFGILFCLSRETTYIRSCISNIRRWLRTESQPPRSKLDPSVSHSSRQLCEERLSWSRSALRQSEHTKTRPAREKPTKRSPSNIPAPHSFSPSRTCSGSVGGGRGPGIRLIGTRQSLRGGPAGKNLWAGPCRTAPASAAPGDGNADVGGKM